MGVHSRGLNIDRAKCTTSIDSLQLVLCEDEQGTGVYASVPDNRPGIPRYFGWPTILFLARQIIASMTAVSTTPNNESDHKPGGGFDNCTFGFMPVGLLLSCEVLLLSLPLGQESCMQKAADTIM
jgi:hypothetical protein